jgi:hypothetical protein
MIRAGTILGVLVLVCLLMPIVALSAADETTYEDAVKIEVNPLLKYTSGSGVPAGGDNYNGPAGQMAIGGGELSLRLGITLGESAGVVALTKLEYESGGSLEITLQQLYIDIHSLVGVNGLRLRIGRDFVSLGPIPLLLDEEFYEDSRDGLQLWLPEFGPVKLFVFGQWGLADLSTSRSVMGARAELTVSPSVVLGLNYRVDRADAADAGICPGVDCNTGSGIGADVSVTILDGATLVLAYAAYTQTGDIARSHYQASLELDLKTLAHMEAHEPKITLWYKSFGPYTTPGGPGGTAPRGAFWTPDDFNLFNINDNLTAFGARLDLTLHESLGAFALGEWGIYKDGGPSYRVFSAGLTYAVNTNVSLKLTYNTYSVTGGTVTTSPVSGVMLGDVGVLHFEAEAKW